MVMKNFPFVVVGSQFFHRNNNFHVSNKYYMAVYKPVVRHNQLQLQVNTRQYSQYSLYSFLYY